MYLTAPLDLSCTTYYFPSMLLDILQSSYNNSSSFVSYFLSCLYRYSYIQLILYTCTLVCSGLQRKKKETVALTIKLILQLR